MLTCSGSFGAGERLIEWGRHRTGLFELLPGEIVNSKFDAPDTSNAIDLAIFVAKVIDSGE